MQTEFSCGICFFLQYIPFPGYSMCLYMGWRVERKYRFQLSSLGLLYPFMTLNTANIHFAFFDKDQLSNGSIYMLIDYFFCHSIFCCCFLAVHAIFNNSYNYIYFKLSFIYNYLILV